MRDIPPHEFSIILDALLRTVLESQYGGGCWSYLSEPSNIHALRKAVRAVLRDSELWRSLIQRVSLTEGTIDVCRRDFFLRQVETFFIERVVSSFRLPVLRIDPRPWDTETVGKRLKGRGLFAVLTGAETTAIAGTVRAIEQGHVGIDYSGCRVIGVPLQNWINGQGRISGGVLVDEDDECRYVTFVEPQPVAAVLMSALPRKHETRLHKDLTTEILALGIPIVNPYSSATRLADKKHLAHEAWREAGIRTPDWCVIPGGENRRRVEESLFNFIFPDFASSEAFVYVLPDDSTEGDRVKRFSVVNENVEVITEYILGLIHATDDALVRRECGNLRFVDNGIAKRAVLRLNVAIRESGETSFSAAWQLACDSTPHIVSPGRGGSFRQFGEQHESFVAVTHTDLVSVPISVWNEAALCRLGINASKALHFAQNRTKNLSFVGFDLIPIWRPGEKFVTWFVLEANVRPAGLGAVRRILLETGDLSAA